LSDDRAKIKQLWSSLDSAFWSDERTERIEAKAKALVRAFGVDAYSEARQRSRHADSEAKARE